MFDLNLGPEKHLGVRFRHITDGAKVAVTECSVVRLGVKQKGEKRIVGRGVCQGTSCGPTLSRSMRRTRALAEALRNAGLDRVQRLTAWQKYAVGMWLGNKDYAGANNGSGAEVEEIRPESLRHFHRRVAN